MRKLIFTALGAAAFLAAGCTIKNKGTAKENQPPQVYFSPIPLENTHFTAPAPLFWYATDADGYIVEFQYSVQPETVVAASVIDTAGKKVGTPIDFLLQHNPDTDPVWQWVSVVNLNRNGQTATIALPSSANPNDSVRSFIFIRALDDRGRYSTQSPNFPLGNSVTWRKFSRQNRPPKAHMTDVRASNQSAFLPGTTIPIMYSLDRNTYDNTNDGKTGHSGITISWFGSDSADYPVLQPDFNYFWELFGPFATEGAAVADSNKLWTSSDRATGLKFTTAKSHTFYGLRGVDTDTNFQVGAYLFRVRTRDDAGVLSVLPATIKFRVIHPRFDKSILLLRKKGSFGGDGEPPGADSSKILNYYLNLVRQAGYGGMIDSAADIKTFTEPQAIPESLLARYRLVICFKEEVFPSVSSVNLITSLKNYMDAGGGVWFMGRDNLTDLSPLLLSPGIYCYERSNSVGGLPFFFYGVECNFTPDHIRVLFQTRTSKEEFIGADALLPGFPTLDIDTNVVKNFLVLTFVPPPRPQYRRVPGVNYFVRAVRSEALYLFRTPFADTSHLNGKVVAVRSDRGTFKSSVFGFTLYSIQEPQAACLMRKMLEWFVGPPSSGAPSPCP